MSGRKGASNSQASFVPVPSVYLDEVMPWLTDTEWRVLLVVIRQTIGWNKERDWITRSQLAYKTGRSQDAVTRAVEGLVRAELIVVEDGHGEVMPSPMERQRRSRERLHYRILTVTQAIVFDLVRQRS